MLSLIVDKREIPESSSVLMLFRTPQTTMVNVFHKFQSLFVSVNQGQAVVLWIHRQQLKQTRQILFWFLEWEAGFISQKRFQDLTHSREPALKWGKFQKLAGEYQESLYTQYCMNNIAYCILRPISLGSFRQLSLASSKRSPVLTQYHHCYYGST